MGFQEKYFKLFSHTLILFLSSECFLQKMLSLTITRTFRARTGSGISFVSHICEQHLSTLFVVCDFPDFVVEVVIKL